MALFRSKSRFDRKRQKYFAFPIFLCMDSERLKQIEEIYHAALEIAPDGREDFRHQKNLSSEKGNAPALVSNGQACGAVAGFTDHAPTVADKTQTRTRK